MSHFWKIKKMIVYLQRKTKKYFNNLKNKKNEGIYQSN